MVQVFVFPSDIVISMRLADSSSIFTAEIWAIIKEFWCLQSLQYMKVKYPLIGMMIESVFCFGGFRANEKADSVAKSALDLLRVKVDVPMVILNIFPLGKMIGISAVRNNLHSSKPVLVYWQISMNHESLQEKRKKRKRKRISKRYY